MRGAVSHPAGKEEMGNSAPNAAWRQAFLPIGECYVYGRIRGCGAEAQLVKRLNH
jgi:hypothetical protein